MSFWLRISGVPDDLPIFKPGGYPIFSSQTMKLRR